MGAPCLAPQQCGLWRRYHQNTVLLLMSAQENRQNMRVGEWGLTWTTGTWKGQSQSQCFYCNTHMECPLLSPGYQISMDIFFFCRYLNRPPLWSSGQSSWLQIQRSGFDSRRYQMFWEVVCLERGPLSLVSTTEELLDRKSSGSSLERREYGRRDPSHWPRGTLYPQKLALTSPSSGGRATEFSFFRSYLNDEIYASTPVYENDTEA
jgi:hypothetical protein